MLTINLLISLCALWLLVVINTNYLQPTLKNRYRFRLYRLRDELALLAMRGSVSENSDEYQLLADILNAAIHATASLKVTAFLRFLARMQRDGTLKPRLSEIRRKVDSVENAEYCRIASETFNVLHALFLRETRAARWVLLPALTVVAALLRVATRSRLLFALNEKRSILVSTDTTLAHYGSEFGRPWCPH